MKAALTTALAIVFLAVIVGSTLAIQNITQPSQPATQVTIGHVPVESFALLYVAQNQGYFTQKGLNVSIVDYPTGTLAAQALVNGTVDFAGSSEYVVTVNAVEKNKIAIVASVGESQIVDLIARQDRQINNPADLKGKTVATAKGTVAEFDVGRFLAYNNLTLQDIRLVYYPPTQFAQAISNGSVDAVASWQLYSEQVKMQLQTGYVVWPLQQDEPFFSVLSSTNTYLSSHPHVAPALIEALADAQNYLDSNPEQVMQIVKAKFNYTDAYITQVWGRNNCSLTLNSKLESVMEHEAAWMIDNNLTVQKTLPNIASFINPTYLTTVKPDAVTLP